ncbi:hypothetical protein [Micromonospora sediminicola]|uniref:hypothetical protein n=1 Tax=Micromonospora sediminicola TaxID=946078 RepID=UPI003407590E
MRTPLPGFRWLAGAAVGVAAVLALGATPAGAAPAGDGGLRLDRFQYATEGVPAGVARPAGTLADPCKTFTYGVNIRTATQTWIGTLYQDVYWCYNGSRVTYHNANQRGSALPGWQFKVTGASSQAGPGNWFFQDTANGQFDLCLPVGGCVGSRHAWINQVVYGDGTYSGSGGES